MRFIRRAKALGFTLAEIRELLPASDSGCADGVLAAARSKVAQVEAERVELDALHERLLRLVEVCADGGDDCVTLDIATGWDSAAAPYKRLSRADTRKCVLASTRGFEADAEVGVVGACFDNCAAPSRSERRDTAHRLPADPGVGIGERPFEQRTQRFAAGVDNGVDHTAAHGAVFVAVHPLPRLVRSRRRSIGEQCRRDLATRGFGIVRRGEDALEIVGPIGAQRTEVGPRPFESPLRASRIAVGAGARGGGF